MTENFIHLNKKLDEIYAGKEHRRRRFDFVAKKAGKYYIVEIKTNKARLNEFEKEGLLLCKRFGFIPLLVRTKVTLIADLDDVTLQLL
jgi:hypothetical protein